MWFDAQAALAEIEACENRVFAPSPPATIATTATNTPTQYLIVADVADVAAPRPQKLEITPSTSDPEIYLAFLHANGPSTYGAIAAALGWGATRAWQAEARLRAAGMVRFSNNGKTYPAEVQL
jgi:hypothetical protein